MNTASPSSSWTRLGLGSTSGRRVENLRPLSSLRRAPNQSGRAESRRIQSNPIQSSRVESSQLNSTRVNSTQLNSDRRDSSGQSANGASFERRSESRSPTERSLKLEISASSFRSEPNWTWTRARKPRFGRKVVASESSLRATRAADQELQLRAQRFEWPEARVCSLERRNKSRFRAN